MKACVQCAKINEYHRELEAYFEELESANPELLKGLEVRGDYDAFVLELAMIGMRTLKRSVAEKRVGVKND